MCLLIIHLFVGPKGKEGKKERKKASKQYFCIAALRTLC
jgi:hypothetical protein